MKRIVKFLKSENGVTSIEYALIAGLIAVVIVVAVTSIGTKLNTTYTTVSKGFP